MKGVSIVTATPKDDGQVASMCREIDPKDYVPAEWPAWRAGAGAVSLICRAAGRVAGCVYGEILAGRDAWAQGLRVHQAFRKRGIASALLCALEKELHWRGAENIFANIGAFNTASLATVSGLDWKIAARIVRRRVSPLAALHEQAMAGPSPKAVARLFRRYPALASRQKTAYFRRAYFSTTPQILEGMLRRSAISLSPHEDAYAMTDPDIDRSEKIWVTALAGEASGVEQLVRAYVGEAGRLRVELCVDGPDDPGIQSLLDRFSFQSAGDGDRYLVFRKAL